MKLIYAYCGTPIKVDDEDYPLLSRYKWRLYGKGYAATKMMDEDENGKQYTIYLHKMVLAAFGFVDHINGDPLDCQKHNMRKATRQQNGFNTRKFKSAHGKPTSSQFKGVMRRTMALPAGVIYARGKPWCFDGLLVKGDTFGNDFTELQLTQIECQDSGEWLDRLEEMLQAGSSHPLDEEGYGRNAMFDDEDLFLVYEADDLRKLASVVDRALAVGLTLKAQD